MNPPRLAHWLVNQLGDDALVGDLLEEFQTGGRSRRWYRNQVLASLAHAVARDVRSDPYLTFRAVATAWIGFQLFMGRFPFVVYPDLLSLSRGWPPVAALEYVLIGWLVARLHRTYRLATVTAATAFLLMWNGADVGLSAWSLSTEDSILVWVAHAVLVTLPLFTFVGGLWPGGRPSLTPTPTSPSPSKIQTANDRGRH